MTGLEHVSREERMGLTSLSTKQANSSLASLFLVSSTEVTEEKKGGSRAGVQGPVECDSSQFHALGASHRKYRTPPARVGFLWGQLRHLHPPNDRSPPPQHRFALARHTHLLEQEATLLSAKDVQHQDTQVILLTFRSLHREMGWPRTKRIV